MAGAAAIAAMRFGTGFRPGHEAPADAAGLLDAVRAGARAALIHEVEPTADRAARLRAYREARRDDRDGPEAGRLRDAARAAFRRDAAARLLQRAFAEHGIFERLAAFWADHFSVAARGLPLVHIVPAHETDAIRPHLAGRFAELLTAAVLHPAMQVYLDQITSFGAGSPAGRRSGRGANENLAREVLELHTLGVGGPYTQRDVAELADLLTGHAVDRETGEATFLPRRAEPGAETVLGRSYGGPRPDAGDALDFFGDLAVHPGTAAHLARKLAVHFVADEPPAALVRHIEAAWTRSRGDLMAVYAALFEHPAAWQGPAVKVRQPQEIVAASLRATGAGPDGIDPAERRVQAGLVGACARMNQPVFRPAGPDGWGEEADHWISPQGLAARLDWAGKLGRVFAERGLDPRRYAEDALGEAMRAETRFLVAAAAEKWEGIALTLASPEFNRR